MAFLVKSTLAMTYERDISKTQVRKEKEGLVPVGGLGTTANEPHSRATLVVPIRLLLACCPRLALALLLLHGYATYAANRVSCAVGYRDRTVGRPVADRRGRCRCWYPAVGARCLRLLQGQGAPVGARASRWPARWQLRRRHGHQPDATRRGQVDHDRRSCAGSRCASEEGTHDLPRPRERYFLRADSIRRELTRASQSRKPLRACVSRARVQPSASREAPLEEDTPK